MLTNLSAFYTKYARRVVTDCSGHSFTHTHLDRFLLLQAAGGGQHSVILANVSDLLRCLDLRSPRFSRITFSTVYMQVPSTYMETATKRKRQADDEYEAK
jgi:hypothetical protein